MNSFDTSALQGNEVYFSIFFWILAITFAISFVVFLVFYLVESIGLFRIAKSRSLEHPGFAFVPIINSYLLGKVGDDISGENGKVKNYRKVMLTLNIIATILAICISIILIPFISHFFEIAPQLDLSVDNVFTNELITAEFAYSFISAFLLYALMGVIAISMAVFTYICLYKIFNRYFNGNGILLLILSIFFPVVVPFFLYHCGTVAKKEVGVEIQ